MNRTLPINYCQYSFCHLSSYAKTYWAFKPANVFNFIQVNYPKDAFGSVDTEEVAYVHYRSLHPQGKGFFVCMKCHFDRLLWDLHELGK